MSRSHPLAEFSVFGVRCSGGSRRRRARASRAGDAFTLIELLVVIAVIAVLAGLTLAGMGGANEQAARKRAKVEISSVGNALEAYRSKYGSYPAPFNGSNLPYTNIARFLQSEKIDVAGDVARDPFGNPYIYLFPGARNRASYDLYSEGRDRALTNAYIGNW